MLDVLGGGAIAYQEGGEELKLVQNVRVLLCCVSGGRAVIVRSAYQERGGAETCDAECAV